MGCLSIRSPLVFLCLDLSSVPDGRRVMLDCPCRYARYKEDGNGIGANLLNKSHFAPPFSAAVSGTTGAMGAGEAETSTV